MTRAMSHNKKRELNVIAFPVSATVFVILAVIGVLAYLGDGTRAIKSRNHRTARRSDLYDRPAPSATTTDSTED